MRHLFLVRNGDYAEEDRLTSVGKMQMVSIGVQIDSILGQDFDRNQVYVISPESNIAVESSKEIVKALLLPRINLDGSIEHCSTERLKQIIYESEKNNYSAAIIVGHSELSQTASDFWRDGQFKGDCDAHKKGEAMYFDLKKRTSRVLRPE